MDIPELNKLIDKRSEAIWLEISNHYEMSLVFHDDPNYMCDREGKKAIFYIARNNYNKCYFAHEILHIYLYTKRIFIGGYLRSLFNENAILSNIFSVPLQEHISNTLDHIKMLQLYLDMGFDRSQFIYDYDEAKCSDNEINLISSFINSDSQLWKLAADLYLGKFFAIKSWPNNSINYTPFLDQLREIDKTLFDILEKFWNSWLNYDIDKYDIRNYNFWDFCDEFYKSLTDWAMQKL